MAYGVSIKINFKSILTLGFELVIML